MAKIETGRRKPPRIDRLAELSRILRVPLGDLLGQTVLMEDERHQVDVPAVRDALMSPRRLSRLLFGSEAEVQLPGQPPWPRAWSRHWETPCDPHVGIATGPANLVAVDLDIPKDDTDTAPPEWAGMADGLDVFAALCEGAGERLPTETYTVRTCRGGQHLYFTAPAEKRLRSTADALGWKVDTRAWGGYVVAVGSVVGGAPYEIIHDAPPAPLPAWLGDLLTPQPAPAPMPLVELSARMRNATSYSTAALRGELEKVLSARQGGRNRAVYFAAYALARMIRNGDLTEAAVSSELMSAGQSIGLPTGECRTAIRSGLVRGGALEASAA